MDILDLKIYRVQKIEHFWRHKIIENENVGNIPTAPLVAKNFNANMVLMIKLNFGISKMSK